MTSNNANASDIKQINQFIQEKKWSDALGLLQKLQKSLPDSNYHYNLGVLLLKNQDFVQAKYHLQKAKYLGHPIKDFEIKIGKINSVLKLNPVQDTFTASFIRSTKNFEAQDYLSLSLILASLGLFILIKQKLKRFWWILLVMLISSSPYVVYQCYLKSFNLALAISPAYIHVGPSKIFSYSKQLKEGEDVVIRKSYNDWVRIESPENLQGWVLENSLTRY